MPPFPVLEEPRRMLVRPVTAISLVLLASLVTAGSTLPPVAAMAMDPAPSPDPDGPPCPPANELCSYLYQPSFCMDYELRGPAVPYCPQRGDLFLATDRGVLA